MSLVELKQDELEQVSGAGFLGDSIIYGVNLFNQTLNTKLISSVGVVFSAVGLGAVHQVADSTGLIASKSLVGLARMLGGTAAETPNHYEKEKGEGQYQILPTLNGVRAWLS